MPKHSEYKGYTAYHVAIIPRTAIRFNQTFTPSDKETGENCRKNELIRQVDGSSFYEIATGIPDALEQLFDYLPQIIEIQTGVKLTGIQKIELSNFFKKAFA